MTATDNTGSATPAPKGHGGRRSPWWSVALKYGVPPVMTVGLCWLLFTGVDFGEMLRIIRSECHFGWILAGLGLSLVSYLMRALRWRIQLRALNVDPPLWALVISIFGTYAVNLIFPRLGELWRTGWIAERQKAPFSTVFGSMICDRLSDTISVGLILLLSIALAHSQMLSYLQQNPEAYARITSLTGSPWLWAGLAASTFIVIWLWRRYPGSRPVVAVRKLVAGIWQGFAVVARMKGKGRWLIYTVLLWGCYYMQLYLAFFAFPATAQVVHTYGATAVLVCFVLSSISMAVPSNGGIGPYQWALVFGLSMYAAGIPGLTREYSLSFANLVMGCQTLALIVLGIITFIAVAVDKRHLNRTSALKK